MEPETVEVETRGAGWRVGGAKGFIGRSPRVFGRRKEDEL